MDNNIKRIKKILKVLEDANFNEIEWEEKDFKIRVKKNIPEITESKNVVNLPQFQTDFPKGLPKPQEKQFAEIRELITAEKLNVNTATAEDLMMVPGVSKELAEAIIEGRMYVEIQNLLVVEGIDEDLLETLDGYSEAKLEDKEKYERGRKSRLIKGAPTPSPNP